MRSQQNTHQQQEQKMSLRTYSFLATLITTFTLGSLSSPVLAGQHKAEMKQDMPAEKAISLTYSDAIFKAAKDANKHIVIDIWKPGCPTCKAQNVVLQEARSLFPNAVFLRVNFLEEKETVKMFGVNRQSVIVVFRGNNENGRVIGETNREKLIELVKTGA